MKNENVGGATTPTPSSPSPSSPTPKMFNTSGHKIIVLKFDDFFEGIFYFLIAFLIGVNIRGYSVNLPRDMIAGWTIFVLVSMIFGLKKIVDAVKGDAPVESGENDFDDD